MSQSIYNLIKEKRKLFYTGKLRNKYKDELITNENVDIYTISNEQNKKQTFTSRSIGILQELFTE